MEPTLRNGCRRMASMVAACRRVTNATPSGVIATSKGLPPMTRRPASTPAGWCGPLDGTGRGRRQGEGGGRGRGGGGAGGGEGGGGGRGGGGGARRRERYRGGHDIVAHRLREVVPDLHHGGAGAEDPHAAMLTQSQQGYREPG